MEQTCLNCGNQFEGNFCNNCGQKAAVHRFSVGHVLHDLPHSIFHIDSGIFRNILSIRHPRKAVAEYLQGKRKSYFNPLLFFLITFGIILFLEKMLGKDPELAAKLRDESDTLHDYGPWIMSSMKWIYLGCVFIFALPNYFLFKKETHFNYAEHVVAYFFILGYVNLAYLVLLPLPFIDSFPIGKAPIILLIIFTILTYSRKGRVLIVTVKAFIATIFQLGLLFLVLLKLLVIRSELEKLFGG